VELLKQTALYAELLLGENPLRGVSPRLKENWNGKGI